MSKVQLAVPADQREALLAFLQEEEIVHIATPAINPEVGAVASESTTGYRLAQVQFALEFIRRIRQELNLQPKKQLKDLFVSKPAASLPELERVITRLDLDTLLTETEQLSETLAQTMAEQQQVTTRITELEPWSVLSLTGHQLKTTAPIAHYLLVMATQDERHTQMLLREVPTAVWQEVKRVSEKKALMLYGELIVHHQDQALVQTFLEKSGAQIVDLQLQPEESIAELLRQLQQRFASLKVTREATLRQAKELLKQEQDLMFAYDALLHLLEREHTRNRIQEFVLSVVITGWIPTKYLGEFTKRFSQAFPDSALEDVPITDTDRPPILFANNKLIQPFEAVTDIYGKPAYHELDPSGALALFFLVAFGLALTDAGYGLLMMASTWGAEKFFRLKRETKKLVRVLFYAGAATTIIGALAGGWFGVTLEELPESGLKDALLAVKLIDPIAQPMVLLMVAFAVGVVQLLFAWAVRGYHRWQQGNKLDVFLDDVPWITLVLAILAWVAAGQGILSPSLEPTLKWVAIANAIVLVLTQGRTYKNPFLKIGGGAISLYGLIGFVSDTLSYSRLLALGLATGIIGLVVNLMAEMVSSSIPVLGLVLAGVVLLIGHGFNLGINALGAFIHSGRLQFVEFFPKFMEGGGVAYRPFGRVGKYVDNPKDFV